MGRLVCVRRAGGVVSVGTVHSSQGCPGSPAEHTPCCQILVFALAPLGSNPRIEILQIWAKEPFVQAHFTNPCSADGSHFPLPPSTSPPVYVAGVAPTTRPDHAADVESDRSQLLVWY